MKSCPSGSSFWSKQRQGSCLFQIAFGFSTQLSSIRYRVSNRANSKKLKNSQTTKLTCRFWGTAETKKSSTYFHTWSCSLSISNSSQWPIGLEISKTSTGGSFFTLLTWSLCFWWSFPSTESQTTLRTAYTDDFCQLHFWFLFWKSTALNCYRIKCLPLNCQPLENMAQFWDMFGLSS